MMRDDEGIVPYSDIGGFHIFPSYGGTGGFRVFLSSGIIATGKIPMAVQCAVYIKNIICNQ